jgi:hypothetical protein
VTPLLSAQQWRHSRILFSPLIHSAVTSLLPTQPWCHCRIDHQVAPRQRT